MALSRYTEKGKIKISDRVIAGIIEESMEKGYQKGRVYPGNAGRTAQEMFLFIRDDFHNMISVEENEHGRLVLRFPVIIRYGESISKVAKELADRVRDELQEALGQDTSEIIIEVRGMRGKSFIKRDMELRINYEA